MKKLLSVSSFCTFLGLGGFGTRRSFPRPATSAHPSSNWRISGFALAAGWLAVLFLSPYRSASAADARDWPQWQGPGRAGVWSSVRLPRRLDPGGVEKLWSARVGGGFSGVVVVGDRVLTMDRVGPGEEERGSLPEPPRRLSPLGPQLSGALRGPGLGQGAPGHSRRRGRGGLYPGSRRQGCLPQPLGRQAALEPGSTEALSAGNNRTWGHSASPSGGRGPGLPAGRRAGRRHRGWPWTAGRAGTAGGPWRTVPATPLRSWPRSDRPANCWCGRPIAWWLSTRGQERKSGGCPSEPAATTWPSFLRCSTAAGCSSRATGTAPWPAACSTVEVPRSCGGRGGLSCLMSTPLWSGDHLYLLDKRDGLLCIHWPSGKVAWSDQHRLTPRGRNPHAALVWVGRRPFRQQCRGIGRGRQRRRRVGASEPDPREVRRPGAGKDHRRGRRACMGAPGIFGPGGFRSQPRGVGLCPGIPLKGGRVAPTSSSPLSRRHNEISNGR